jgi:hypothetical protein
VLQVTGEFSSPQKKTKSDIWFSQLFFNPKGLLQISHLKENLMQAKARQQPQNGV